MKYNRLSAIAKNMEIIGDCNCWIADFRREHDPRYTVCREQYREERVSLQHYIETGIRMGQLISPCSGFERSFSTDRWNSSPILEHSNCYCYALGIGLRGGWAGPGYFSGQKSKPFRYFSVEEVIDLMQADAEVLGIYFGQIGFEDRCAEGTYKIALALDPENGQGHYYRQDCDNSWSHKIGRNEATNRDASGDIILNPQTADRNYGFCNYSKFLGFFAVGRLVKDSKYGVFTTCTRCIGENGTRDCFSIP